MLQMQWQSALPTTVPWAPCSVATLHPSTRSWLGGKPKVLDPPDGCRALTIAACWGAARAARAHAVARLAGRAAQSPFEIRDVPGKGLGAVAVRDLAEGELVIEERPPITFVDAPNWEEKIQKQFETLPKKTQEALMSLHDTEEPKTLTGIFNTNSIGCYSESLDGSLCVLVSRFNHSCVPNCEQFWDDEMFRQKLFACKDIKKGEELCFSYLEPFLPYTQREEIFRRRYAFQCHCPACQEQSHDASDQRRRRLGELVRQLNRGVSPDADAGTSLAKELLQLCDEEGLALQGFRAQASYHAFQCLLLARRPAEEALPWIHLARSQLQKSRGADHPDVRVLRGYEEQPLSHPAATDEQIDWSSIVPAAVLLTGAAWFFLKGQG
ncbi:unnamed protein product [Durusdinium trenchii]|uniref:SET domain-containing protein n=1 Tax=Durusdinium trenchii TaxID=1381693 RepID=A0ABP0M786_9DINO